MRNQKIVLKLELLAEEWLDEQEAINQVSQILKDELKNDPHIAFFDCDMIECALTDNDEEEQVCRLCGCTWDSPCTGGCYWVERDLCSKCAEEMKSKQDKTEEVA